MTTTLIIGLVALAGAIGLGWVAATSRTGASIAHPGLASIDEYYSPELLAPPDGQLLQAPLSITMVGLGAFASRLSPANVLERIQQRLDVAGNSRRWTAQRVLGFKGFGLLALGGLGLLSALGQPLMMVLFTVIGATAGFYLPDVLLYNTGTKRQMRIQQGLPDALDMMTVCVEAGLGIDAAIAQVARNTEGPLAAEFARVLQEMQFGKSRSQALRAMAGRTTVAELKTFVSALTQASDLGIPIAVVLREQASELRTRRRQRGEEQAQKVTVKILFPLIFCLFPALMIVVIGPGAINIFRMFTGH